MSDIVERAKEYTVCADHIHKADRDLFTELILEIERLRSVLDAARSRCLGMMKDSNRSGDYIQGKVDAAGAILRVLDGEPPQPKGYGMEEYTRDMNSELCPMCGDKGRVLVETYRRPIELEDGAASSVITYESWPCETCSKKDDESL